MFLSHGISQLIIIKTGFSVVDISLKHMGKDYKALVKFDTIDVKKSLHNIQVYLATIVLLFCLFVWSLCNVKEQCNVSMNPTPLYIYFSQNNANSHYF